MHAANSIITTSLLKVVVESTDANAPFFKIWTYDMDVLYSENKVTECEVCFPNDVEIMTIEDARAIHDALGEFLERVDAVNKKRKEVEE